MSLCNRVIVHFDNVGESIENVYSDVAYMDDLRINPDNPETVISSWLIRREATQIVGILSFSIQYQCVEDEEITYEWNTDSYDDIEIRKSKNNGEAAVINYTNVLEQWRSQIFGAGNSVMTNITTEGANQVAAVQNESATQQAAIELKGSETLATIPEDYTEVYNMANEAVRTKADGIVCETEGEVITIVDSSDDYIRGLKLYGKTTQATTSGKNLCSLGTVDCDALSKHQNSTTLQPGVYTLSAVVTSDDADDVVNLIRIYEDDESSFTDVFIRRSTNDTRVSATFTIDTERNCIFLYASSGYNTSINDTATFKDIQIEVGNVATEYEPYTGGKPAPNPDYPMDLVGISDPSIGVYSGNIANVHGITKGSNQTVAVSKDGRTIVCTGGADTTYTSSSIELPSKMLRGKTVVLQIEKVTNSQDYTGKSSNVQLNIETSTGKKYVTVSEKTPKATAVIPEDTTRLSLNIYTNNSSTVFERDNTTTVEGLSLTIADIPWDSCKVPQLFITEHTLHGIPVTAGGNYTDSTGQQWICDEIDFERGVCVQRINRLLFDGTENWSVYDYQSTYSGFSLFNVLGEIHSRTQGLSNQFYNFKQSDEDGIWVGVGNMSFYVISKEWYNKGLDAWKAHLNEKPLEVIYPRLTPIETPLTAEEIETYKTLRTNYPNTTVLNDSGAMMSVKYNADLKLYMEQFSGNAQTAPIAKIGTVTLLASAWEGTNNLYSQVVDIDGVTENSQVDLTPGIDQLAVFYDKDLSFVTENDRGVVTVYAIGQKPTNDYTIQVTITEVEL